MMHGYGYAAGDWTHMSGSLFGGTGWMVISMMGIGLLVLVGLVAWFVWTQREALGLATHVPHGQQTTMGTLAGPRMDASSTETVEQIAQRRYATGEISADEYREMMATLKSQQ